MASSWKPSADTAGALLSRQHAEIFYMRWGAVSMVTRCRGLQHLMDWWDLWLWLVPESSVPSSRSLEQHQLGPCSFLGGIQHMGEDSVSQGLREDCWDLTLTLHPLRSSLWMWSTAPNLSLCGDETKDMRTALGPLQAWRELDQWQLWSSHFISCKRLQLYGQERPFLASLTKTLKTGSQDEIPVLQFNQGSELGLRQPAPEQVVVLMPALLTCVPWPVISVITLEYTSHHRHQENPQVSRQLVKEEKSGKLTSFG